MILVINYSFTSSVQNQRVVYQIIFKVKVFTTHFRMRYFSVAAYAVTISLLGHTYAQVEITGVNNVPINEPFISQTIKIKEFPTLIDTTMVIHVDSSSYEISSKFMYKH